MKAISGKERIEKEFIDFLSDESRLNYIPVDNLYFPNTIDEVKEVVCAVKAKGESLVVSGARTGIVGNAVPLGEKNLISLSSMESVFNIEVVDGKSILHVSPEFSLEDINDRLLQDSLWLPVNPTEQSASIGGAVSMNASGSRSYSFGSMRDWVYSLKVVLPSGELFEFKRGDYNASNYQLNVNGKVLQLPRIEMPDTKNTLGYYISKEVDLVDLFVGSEGTLGVIVEVGLYLVERPSDLFGQITFFDSREKLDLFLNEVVLASSIKSFAVEYFCSNSLQLLRLKKGAELCSQIPKDAVAAIYTEYPYANNQEYESILDYYICLYDKLQISDGFSWVADNKERLEEFRLFRHSVPEEINRLVAEKKRVIPTLRKFSTDMAVPFKDILSMLDMYETLLNEKQLSHFTFGHIGDGHVHVNVVPSSEVEIKQIGSIFKSFADKVVSLGGAVSAEHGIGRLKKDYLLMQYGKVTVDQMREIKSFFDPHNVLNPGLIF